MRGFFLRSGSGSNIFFGLPVILVFRWISADEISGGFFDKIAEDRQGVWSDAGLEAGRSPTDRKTDGWPLLAPEPALRTAEIRKEIEDTIHASKGYAEDVHAEKSQLKMENGLNPSAHRHAARWATTVATRSGRHVIASISIFSTTPIRKDSIGFEKIGDLLPKCWSIVFAKSGGTKETRNGMLKQSEVAAKGLQFARTLCGTGVGSDWTDTRRKMEGCSIPDF